MNICIIKGNLTRDPELRYTPNGTQVCDLGVAVNHKWTDGNGEKKEEVNFFDAQSWGKTAEVIAQYFKKGKPILLQGRLKQDQWKDKTTGENRYKVKIVVDRFEFCGEGKAATGESPQRSSRVEAAHAPETGGHGDDANDDVPF